MLDAVDRPARNVAVVGLGYVGLPLAQAAAGAGLRVVGLDLDPSVVNGLNSGCSHVDDVPDGQIETMLEQGFAATDDPTVLRGASVVVICVPTPLATDGGPDLTAVIGASSAAAAEISAGTLVVLESTTYPGTTEEVLLPLFQQRGFEVGMDFHLAFSPERIDPGNPTYGVRNTPKVVGGVTPACADRAEVFYSQFVETVVRARGTREAEMAKLLENTYRHINIALVNEMAQFCHELDIDLWDVIRCARTKPFGFHAFYPGPGVGGHCIPIDPNYLSHRVHTKLGYPFRFVELAQEINSRMPTYVFRRIQDLLNEDRKALRGSTVLLLGVTYKPDIADQRESPARPLAQQLLDAGADLRYHDPLVGEWTVGGHPIKRVDDLDDELGGVDIAVLLQNHQAYDIAGMSARAVRLLDTRGVADGARIQRL